MLPYLARTFLERGDGFHFSATVPPEILKGPILKNSDPWEVLACTLANLQNGNFEVSAVPIDLMKHNEDVNLWIACAHLVGYAAPMGLVRSLFEYFSHAMYDSRKRYLCTAAVDAGALWSVEHILALYVNTKDADERRYLEFELSWLMEEEDGRLWAGPESLETSGATNQPYIKQEWKPDVEGYVKTVRDRLEELHQSTGFDRLPISEGRLFDVERVAKTLVARLKQGDRSYRIDRARMLLEGTTGLDCGGFFNDRYILQPLAAASIVEAFLESDEVCKYEPGVRYFFGHRVPD